MSKIGKKPISIPGGITVTLMTEAVLVKGPKGERSIPTLPGVTLALEGSELRLAPTADTKQARSNWGTLRALLENAIHGQGAEFKKILILEGVGFRMTKEGNDLAMTLGFSHPVKYKAPEGIVFDIEKNTILTVKGADKAAVGQAAAEIRALKKPDPYKGKGFHYSTEVIRRKAGKKAATATAAA